MAISKRLRYEVLRRDNYTCRYCGAKAPDVEITVDHVIPVSLGGTDEPSNLVAACRPCNGGKTSSSPDAPLVADVADKALEWAGAIRQAQAQMLADIQARERDREQFSQWWDGWKLVSGDAKTSVPKDPAWWVTIDQLLGAGLPLAALKECIDLAMTQKKVQDENRFRYMCGVAWNKVKALQKSARAITAGTVTEIEAGISDPFEEGRLSLARELLDEVTEEERAYFLDACDMTGWQEDGDEPQTESQQACEALGALLNSARCNADWVIDHLKSTLERLPSEIGSQCLAEFQREPPAPLSDPLSEAGGASVRALRVLEDLVHFPQAKAWAIGLDTEELAEWLEFVHALYPSADLSEERLACRAYRTAKIIADGNYFTAMCGGRGVHIDACPARATYRVKIAELDCCIGGQEEDHDGHPVCERHMEQLIDGTYVGRSGQMFTLTDFTEVPAPKDVWAAA